MLLLGKVTKGAVWEGFSFPEKPGKSAFRFAKSIRDGFNVTFSLVRKSNQKVHQRAAKRRCKIAPSGYPGNGSKFRAVDFFD